ncbi:MAG: glycoside hydrolase family 3 C-terminal domain-containing protein, partial [Bacilli bacterium]
MKKKLSNKKFHIITLSVMGLCLGLGIAGTIVSNYFANSLDNYLGRGEIIYDEGREGITYDDSDTEFYDQPFEKSTQGKTDSSHAAYKIGEKINDEGEVLLKNDGTLPLAKNTAVTPFGYRYVDPIMTGTGSGAATLLQDFVVDASTGLSHYFNVNTKMESVLKNASPIYATSTGYKSKADENGTFSGATSSVGEFNSSQIYQTSEIGNYKTGIVFIGRQGGEGNDLQKTAYFEGGKKIADHQLQLMPYEKDMLAFAKTNCDKVIVILNSPNPIELGDLKN